MIFCLGEDQLKTEGSDYPKNLMVFNKRVTENEYNQIKSSLSNVKISHTYWVNDDEMTNGGYLKRISYEEAWINWWATASQYNKNKILNIPQFDAKIFKEITSIDVGVSDDKTLEAMELLKRKGYKIVKNGL